ncbi:MAG: hypothetical protein JWM28_2605 [Chitinophagaceae bacterium]|nr:hypothetical protein [Chitinophagaceae bacterium]
MIPGLPLYISVSFIIVTLITVYLFYRASHQSDITFIVLASWLMIQAVLSLKGFYTKTDTIPPRFALLAAPALLLILLLFITKKGRIYIDNLDAKQLTNLHFVRVPVEIILFALYSHQAIPGLMTFEGRNFDIFSGVTAPLIAWLGYEKKQLPGKALLVWNFICLALVLNVVINGILSAPSRFQQFAFDQPNTAILYFPFAWLPACIVPIVIFSHLVCIRQLLRNN